MTFVANITTSRGGKRTIEVPGTSVQDAIDYIKVLYPKCEIKDIDLKPKKKGVLK